MRPPKNWDRCHAYLERKGRFCRQQVKSCGNSNTHTKKNDVGGNETTYIPQYCGNHFHFYQMEDHFSGMKAYVNINANVYIDGTNENRKNDGHDKSNAKVKKKRKLNRIPCPIDPSHTIYEHMIEKHILICPKVKLQNQIQKSPYFIQNINTGGFDQDTSNIDANITTTTQTKTKDTSIMTQERAQRLAISVLCVYTRLFSSSSSLNLKNTQNSIPQTNVKSQIEPQFHKQTPNVTKLTTLDLYNAIPTQDLSKPEEKAGLSKSIASNKIKTGGLRHMQQQASIIGHLRRKGLMHETCNVLEMGAGRGMLGLLVAGAIASQIDSSNTAKTKNITPDDVAIINRDSTKNTNNDAEQMNESVPSNQKISTSKDTTKVNLVMVERSASRYKAETRIRQAKKTSQESTSNFTNELDLSPQEPSLQSSHSSSSSSPYLKLANVEFHRIRCDLAHIHLPLAIPKLLPNIKTVCTVCTNTNATNDEYSLPTHKQNIQIKSKEASYTSDDNIHDTTYNNHAYNNNNEKPKPLAKNQQSSLSSPPSSKKKTIAIAKHLCGSGTDLALKSLSAISQSVNGCAFATCCHGLCSWDDYVGRSYLQEIFASCCPHQFITISTQQQWQQQQIPPPRRQQQEKNLQRNEVDRGDQICFGKEEFDLMRKWTSGCVHNDENDQDSSETNGIIDNKINKKGHDNTANDDNDTKYSQSINFNKNISSVVESLNLSCGVKGLGRACQRIIDHGRTMYMKEKLKFLEVEMIHYVDEKVTPQNSLLIATK